MSEDTETGDYYARCPDENCDFSETEIPDKDARELQKRGCPNCDDNRSLAVAEMDAFPEA
jgi:hypothetical protein